MLPGGEKFKMKAASQVHIPPPSPSIMSSQFSLLHSFYFHFYLLFSFFFLKVNEKPRSTTTPDQLPVSTLPVPLSFSSTLLSSYPLPLLSSFLHSSLLLSISTPLADILINCKFREYNTTLSDLVCRSNPTTD